ncbi:MAG: AtpZ/AtpI family protein [Parvularculaceae bacterium]
MGDPIKDDGADAKNPPSMDDFSSRLERARGQTEEPAPKGSASAWGQAMRVSSELLAGLFVGCLLGLGLDHLLHTKPWFLLAGIGLGFAAGLRNLSRAMKN